MLDLPTGTVTFLFTDIEGSTALWEQHRDAMRAALVRHDALVEQVVAEHHGHVVRPRGEGDSRFAVFARATDAVAAAAALQQALHVEPWPTSTPLRVRMALHTGEADLREGDYYGSAVNRCARLRAVAHGGQALVSLTTEQLVRGQLAEGVALRDLGSHRLKDLHHPERIFQLLVADVTAEFPPLTTVDARPNNIPIQPTPFIGRAREVAALQQRLLDPQVRLLTMTGPGGTGKTRLALQAAAEALDDFTDGAWLVELAPMNDPAQVLAAIGAVFGMTDSGGKPLAERLVTFLRPKHLLLVLDNFEQVLVAASDIALLLAHAAGLTVLVTSRAVLRLSAEHTFPVPPLGLPDQEQPPALAAMLQSDAVTFFLKRAQAAKPDFALTEANAPAVAEICARLDGLPLALELAAARCRLFAPQALLARLQPDRSRLQFLTGGARDTPARQQTIRNTIAWSYGLLSEAEQRLFRRLAVFVGGWTVEAAEEVCDIDGDLELDVLEGLTGLAEQSLLRQVDGPDGAPRFRRLETIREYAVEQFVASDEADALRKRHAAYFLMVAEETDRQLTDQAIAVDAVLARLVAEQENLRAVLKWALDNAQSEAALQMAAALRWFWSSRAPQEGRRWLATALAMDSSGPAPLRARALAVAANQELEFSDCDYAMVRSWAEESLSLFRTLEDNHGSAWALLALGSAAAAQRTGHARSLLEESLELFAEAEDFLGLFSVFQVYRHLPELALEQEGGARVQVIMEQTLARCRHRQNYRANALLCNILGILARERGEYQRGEGWLGESLRLYRQLGDQGGIAWQQHDLSELAMLQGDDMRAQALGEQSLDYFRQVGDKHATEAALINLGYVAQHQAELRRAFSRYAEALQLAREQGAKVHTFDSLAGMAGLTDPGRAARLFGAVEAMRKADQSRALPHRRREEDHNVAAARACLDEATWDEAWAEGQAMTLEQAIAYALEDTTNA